MWIFGTSVDKNVNSLAVLILRVVAGGFMLVHGLEKLEMLKANPVQFADPIGIGEPASLTLAVFAELVCSALLILGLLTRLAIIPLIITMLVAVFIVHAADGFEKQELGALYLGVYIVLIITGAGKFSVDRLIAKRKSRY
ncbi:DoxX family protein [Flavobacterium rivuli WB 3.3-2 = DSM 21788]|uniref:DoxX family protein n=1 Tax=Flavobacterium rivuli WB 3.3-2 = DSM 21788 TaxID=1121895 RepID=A0A0A2LWI3_9FLAO|nr:DoxX family protein [Flavobacterium rivuli]KGO84697.1 DoxX family protein [Flavobacterium rivuli WB 3.3-2 = DSM 21788]